MNLSSEVLREIYKTPRNEHEALVHSKLLSMGYAVLRKGWPDFIAFSDTDVFAVEVKGGSDVLRPAQKIVLETLSTCFDTYVAQRQPESNDFVFSPMGESSRWLNRG